MNENNWNIIKRLSQKLLGEASPEDEQVLEKWRKENPRHQALWEELTRPEAYEKNEQELAKFSAKEGWARMERRLGVHPLFGRYKRLMHYAAAFLILITLAGGVWLYTQPHENNDKVVQYEIEAGTQSAQLILNDQQMIMLTSTNEQYIYNNELEGITILQEAGNLKYTTDIKELPDTLIYNQIRTLSGMEYYITFFDNTQIHLNAESHLTYPIFFQDSERKVSFEGEGYFQVSKDEKRPFLVDLGGVTLQVLGTSFNLRAYADEPQIYITLESGSLAMEGVHITPGKQIIYDKESKTILTRDVNTKEFVSWHEGHFLFRNERLEDILRYLARWYDFTYEFDDEAVKDVRFGAYFERYNSMQPILNMLKNTGLVDFSVKGKNIKFSSF